VTEARKGFVIFVQPGFFIAAIAGARFDAHIAVVGAATWALLGREFGGILATP
jgi:hypothetical protein